MSWDQHHSRSETLAAEAEMATRVGEAERAKELYRQAAAEEWAAFGHLSVDKERTRGITAVSAVSLFYKGQDYATAERLARDYLHQQLPAFADAQLDSLLGRIAERGGTSKSPVSSESPSEVSGPLHVPYVIENASRGLETTQDDLNWLLKHLDGDREAAWEKYRTIWQKLEMFFQCHNCPSPSEHADEALSRIARRDDLADIRSIPAFAYGVARKMSLEIYEDRKKQIPIEDLPGGTVADRRNVELEALDNIDTDRRLRCIRLCLEKLPSDERLLFINFQTADPDTHREDRRKLAANAGISAGALRVRVFRIRRDLERCARKCLKTRVKREF